MNLSPRLPRLLFLLATLAAMLAIVAMFLGRRELSIVPLNPNPDSIPLPYSYADSDKQGDSRIDLLEADSLLRFAYEFGDTYQYPYAGVGLPLGKDSAAPSIWIRDLSGYDTVHLSIRTRASTTLRLQLITHDPVLSRPHTPLSNRYMTRTITVDQGWKDVSVALGDFAIPDWWYQENHVRPESSERHFERAVFFEICAGSEMARRIPDTVEVRSVSFTGHDDSWAIGYAFAAVLLTLIGGILFWHQHTRERIRAESMREARRTGVLDSYGKLPLESHRTRDAARILEFINANYHDPELTVESATKATGLNRNKLAAILKDEVGTTFKAFVNDIRLKESARALLETDLQVTEVAYKVGFGNVSHFNRVFKERYQLTPVEYRKTGGKTP